MLGLPKFGAGFCCTTWMAQPLRWRALAMPPHRWPRIARRPFLAPRVRVRGQGMARLFTTSLPREMSARLVAACRMISRTVPSLQFLDEIDLPLLILLAPLLVVNEPFRTTGVADEAPQTLISHGLSPDRASILAPLSLLLSKTIGNVPAVVMILQVRRDVPEERDDPGEPPSDALGAEGAPRKWSQGPPGCW